MTGHPAKNQHQAQGCQKNREAAEENGRFPVNGQRQAARKRKSARGFGELEKKAGNDGQKAQQEHHPAQAGHPSRILHVFPDIEPQQQIADEPAQVVECAEGVPGGLPPEREQGGRRQSVGRLDQRRLSPCGGPDGGNERGKNPDAQIHGEFLPGNVLRPGRQHRHHQIDARQHIDKPKMACRIIEVEQQPLQVLHRLSPHQGIDQRPEYHGDQDTDDTALEKLPRSVVQRELQVTGSDEEKRNAAAAEAFEDRHPESIGGCKDKGSVPPEIERFRAMDDHDHEAGCYPQEIQPGFSLSHRI